MQTQLSTGNARRETPAFFRDLKDDLAVEICFEMKRRGWNARDLTRLGYNERRCRDVHNYLRGVDYDNFGYICAIELAARLNIPIRVMIGADETTGIGIRDARQCDLSRRAASIAA